MINNTFRHENFLFYKGKSINTIKLLFILLVPGTHMMAYAQDSLTVPPDQSVKGQSQSSWSRAWWQWAGSFQRGESPVSDQTGEFCNSRQQGDVWFLAGTYGTHRTVRTCTVPKGKYLFFPLINYVVMPTSIDSGSCSSKLKAAASITNNPSLLILELDGVRIENLASYRQATTECFDMGTLAKPKVRVFPSAANGYYAMLRPLKPGKHVLNFGGVLPGMIQAVTYTLYVE